MIRLTQNALLLVVLILTSKATAQVTETGQLVVYSDASEGAITASGASYSRSALTAAHLSLPFGTRVRVANFDTGRMVDVVINDRKAKDRNVLVLSRAAADQIGMNSGGTANGALFHGGATPAPTAKKSGPLAAIFGKGAASGGPVQYGIPADRYAPPIAKAAATKKAGGLFGAKSSPASFSYPDTSLLSRPELQPLNAGGPVVPGLIPAAARAPLPTAPLPAAALPAPAPSVALPPASPNAPYRVQFGAFRRLANAEELSGMLDGAGIPSSVFMDSERGLNVVVSDGGFSSASEAQRWIDYEGARRGWTERPVVIR